jgi:hypothetical protein
MQCAIRSPCVMEKYSGVTFRVTVTLSHTSITKLLKPYKNGYSSLQQCAVHYARAAMKEDMKRLPRNSCARGYVIDLQHDLTWLLDRSATRSNMAT